MVNPQPMQHTMPEATHDEHRDDMGSKIGMWLFIFTEILLFGGLFIVYAVYHNKFPEAFHLMGQQLDVNLGTINTLILLVSSATVAMSITAIQRNDKAKSLLFLGITLVSALAFLVNKYFEWGAKFHHGLYPQSEHMQQLSYGDNLFISLYFAMTGIHGLHILVGMVLLGVVAVKVARNQIRSDRFQLLENSGLYWHLVDLIWIFLFPLFYLIA